MSIPIPMCLCWLQTKIMVFSAPSWMSARFLWASVTFPSSLWVIPSAPPASYICICSLRVWSIYFPPIHCHSWLLLFEELLLCWFWLGFFSVKRHQPTTPPHTHTIQGTPWSREVQHLSKRTMRQYVINRVERSKPSVVGCKGGEIPI